MKQEASPSRLPQRFGDGSTIVRQADECHRRTRKKVVPKKHKASVQRHSQASWENEGAEKEEGRSGGGSQ